jgi:hypothetical protein
MESERGKRPLWAESGRRLQPPIQQLEGRQAAESCSPRKSSARQRAEEQRKYGEEHCGRPPFDTLLIKYFLLASLLAGRKTQSTAGAE